MATVSINSSGELLTAIGNANPGDTLIVEPGTYTFNDRVRVTRSGTADHPITLRSREGSRPTLSWQGTPEGQPDGGMLFYGAGYWVMRGFEVVDSGWKGVNVDSGGHDLVFEDLRIHRNSLWGFMVNNGRDILVRNCDSYDNMDRGGSGENSDGFNVSESGAANVTFENCRAWDNGDDGYDLWQSTGHTIRNCWAMNNGRGSDGDGNGFKLGPGGGHTITGSVAYGNSFRGFDYNGAIRQNRVYNNTAWNNPINFRFTEGNHDLRNNLNADGEVQIGSGVTQVANSWNLGLSGTQNFQSVTPGSDGFLQLRETSPAIDAGVDVGLEYVGSAPDLGAFEAGLVPPEEPPQVEDPVAESGFPIVAIAIGSGIAYEIFKRFV